MPGIDGNYKQALVERPNVVVDAIDKHIGRYGVVMATFSAALVSVSWFSISGGDRIDIFGLSVSKDQTFFLAFAIYTSLGMSAVILLMRVRDLLYLLADDEQLTGFIKLSLHASVFNPFCQFGQLGLVSRAQASMGVFLSALVFIGAGFSLMTLCEDFLKIVSIVWIVYIVAGFSNVHDQVHAFADVYLCQSLPTIAEGRTRARNDRWIASLIVLVVILLFLAARASYLEKTTDPERPTAPATAATTAD